MLRNDMKSIAFSIVALFGFWLIFCLPWFLGEKVIPYDAKNHFYAMIRFLAQAYHSGDGITWSPFHYGGFPMIADPQSIIFTPSLWLPVLLSKAPSMFLVDVTHLSHLLVTGVAVFCFGHSRGWRAEASLLTALSVMFGGTLAIRLEHVLMTVSFMWLCVALWRLDVVINKGGWVRGLAFGAPLAFLLVDRNHVAMLGAWFLFFYWLCHVLPALLNDEFRFVFKRHYPVLIGGVFALLIIAIPLLLLLQLAGLSNRPAFGLEEASWQSLQPVSTFSFFFPQYFGSLVTPGDYWGPASNAWGEAKLKVHRGMLHIYTGTLTVVVLFLLGLARGRLFISGARYFLIFGIVMLLYALGRFTPLYATVYDYVPGINLFRRPADAAFIFSLTISLYAGTLIDDGLRNKPQTWSKIGIATAVFVAVALVVGGFYLAYGFGRLADYFTSLIVFLVLAGFIGTGLSFMNKGTEKSLFAFCFIGLLVAGDLIYHSSGLKGNARPPDYYAQQARALKEPVFQTLADLLKTPDPSGMPWRVETLGLGPTLQNVGQTVGFHDLLGYNPIRLGVFEEKIGPDMQNNAPRRRYFGSDMTSYSSALTNQLGLKYIITSVPLEKLDPNVDETQFTKIEDAELIDRPAFIYENKRAEPRVVFQLPNGITQPARVSEHKNDVVKISIKANQNGLLILRNFVYPGWEVTVDGKAAPLETHDGLFQAVFLKAGEREIIFSYHPLSIDNLKAALQSLFSNEQS